MKAFIERARRTAVELERLLDERVNALVRTTPRGLQPLEVRHAVLDEIESRLVPGPNGLQLFPYDEVRVELLGGTADDVAALEATLQSDEGLAAAAHARLARRGCRAIFEITIADLRSAEPSRDADLESENRYRIRFLRRPAPGADTKRAETPAPDTVLTVTVGTGPEAVACSLAQGRLHVGRVADVRDRDGRLVRQNGLVIPEALDPNGTVSRRHAHVAATREAAGTSYRVFDDGSRYGTSIVRSGRTIAVHAGSLGVALRDGDELHFGEAVASVSIASHAAAAATSSGC